MYARLRDHKELLPTMRFVGMDQGWCCDHSNFVDAVTKNILNELVRDYPNIDEVLLCQRFTYNSLFGLRKVRAEFHDSVCEIRFDSRGN